MVHFTFYTCIFSKNHTIMLIFIIGKFELTKCTFTIYLQLKQEKVTNPGSNFYQHGYQIGNRTTHTVTLTHNLHCQDKVNSPMQGRGFFCFFKNSIAKIPNLCMHELKGVYVCVCV